MISSSDSFPRENNPIQVAHFLHNSKRMFRNGALHNRVLFVILKCQLCDADFAAEILFLNSSAELLARLNRLPSQIEAEDIPDLVTLAQVC